MSPRLPLILLACAGAAALSGCKPDGSPSVAANGRAPTAYSSGLPDPGPLDPTASLAAVNANPPALYNGYALAERAHAFDRAVYRKPPTYGFRYRNARPLVWRTADDYAMYAEPIGGGYRDYYYAPGADYPYFVRDPEYAYGYGPDGALVAAYDASGALLPDDRLYQLAAIAGRYLIDAQDLRRYGLDDSYRTVIAYDDWTRLAPAYYAFEEPWYLAYDRQPDWLAWRARHGRDFASYYPRGGFDGYAAYAEPGHDNGRHLGWYKHDQGGWRGGPSYGRGRQIAFAEPGRGNGGGQGGGAGHGGGGGGGGGGLGGGHGGGEKHAEGHGGGNGHGGGGHGNGHGKH
ncbi:MAG: hypothetical protein JWR43_1774 [Phenylobacterium sp.]|nr:hypothetical protein [Phenylobacterium sp.]